MQLFETEKEVRLEKRQGKFVLTRREVFKKAQDVYSYFNKMMQTRAKMASEITEYEMAIEKTVKYLETVDEEINRIKVHMSEILKATKEEYEKSKKEREEQLKKGPTAQKPLVNTELKDPAAIEDVPEAAPEEKKDETEIKPST